ncbi:MAG: glutamate--tRNA ligase, partial [Candidatus Methanoperedens sp.]|nr:glutamate--tRNA ligase [Candidatus Methanoperedens sp.]
MPRTEEIKLLIKKYALQNAVKYSKTPQATAVMGKVMANPELRSQAKEITALVGEVLGEIEQMTQGEREEE